VQNSASSKGARYYFKRAAGQEMLVLNWIMYVVPKKVKMLQKTWKEEDIISNLLLNHDFLLLNSLMEFVRGIVTRFHLIWQDAAHDFKLVADQDSAEVQDRDSLCHYWKRCQSEPYWCHSISEDLGWKWQFWRTICSNMHGKEQNRNIFLHHFWHPTPRLWMVFPSIPTGCVCFGRCWQTGPGISIDFTVAAECSRSLPIQIAPMHFSCECSPLPFKAKSNCWKPWRELRIESCTEQRRVRYFVERNYIWWEGASVTV
jgi:hypothetical protein